MTFPGQISGVASRRQRKRDRRFRRFPDERQRSLVSAIGPQFDFERFDGSGERFQIHFRAAEIGRRIVIRSEEHTSELQSRGHLVCRLLPGKKEDRGRLVLFGRGSRGWYRKGSAARTG